ncbi:benzoate/H(+) symporter BenE family transporter [Pseudarthrobacter sp. B907]|uniref:benzoate/H(+) symporter BenE family transporter n=1 Tax=Pseudarthrobacter sp. B907 TaxID=3158261 RepID=UPI0032DBBE35
MLPSRQDPSAVLAEAVAAPLRQSLLERPGVAPAGLRSLLRDLGVPYVSNGVIGFIFSASGPIAVTLAVGTAGGLTEGQLASWVFGILFSGGAATLVMSLLYRQPLGFAWSIPGTVLLGPSLQHLSFPEVVGAFFTSGILVLALGATGVVRRIMAVVPMPIVMAMVAAVFLKFGTDVVTSTQANPVVAAPMVIVFLVLTAVPALGRVLPPVLGTLAIGCVAVAASGQFSFHGGPILASPAFTLPEFTWAAQLELVVPLALTVLFVQNGQGIAVLRAAGHTPPVNVFAIVSGAFSLLNACCGAVSACVTGPTNALLTSSGTRQRQYASAVVFGVLAIGCALFRSRTRIPSSAVIVAPGHSVIQMIPPPISSTVTLTVTLTGPAPGPAPGTARGAPPATSATSGAVPAADGARFVAVRNCVVIGPPGTNSTAAVRRSVARDLPQPGRGQSTRERTMRLRTRSATPTMPPPPRPGTGPRGGYRIMGDPVVYRGPHARVADHS